MESDAHSWKERILSLHPSKDAPLLDVPSERVSDSKLDWWLEDLIPIEDEELENGFLRNAWDW